MANGKIRFGKQLGGQLALVIPDGVTNTEVIVPESGILAKTSDINTAGVELKTIATGTATFTATTNNINLTGIGVGVEIGDVIQISGATDSKNNSEFTVEVITDNNNIIVNQAHANKDTSKNVATRVSNTGVTVKLLAKWYNAPVGLGQEMVDVSSIRLAGTSYRNNTKRLLVVKILRTGNSGTNFYANDKLISDHDFGGIGTNPRATVGGGVAVGNNYKLLSVGSTFNTWLELR